MRKRAIAGSIIKAGDRLVVGPRGSVVRLRPYSLTERAIRAAGRLAKVRRLAQYHDRQLVGFATHKASIGESVQYIVYPIWAREESSQ